MRKVPSILALSCLIAAGCSGDKAGGDQFAVFSNDIPATITRTPGPASSDEDVVPGKFVVKLKGEAQQKSRVKNGRLETDRESLRQAMDKAKIRGARSVHAGPDGRGHAQLGGVYVVESDDRDADSVRRTLRDSGEVEYVEPVVRYHRLGQPNDPYYEYQWNLAELNLPKAHEVTKGKGAVVAVVDSGVSAGSDGFANLLSGYDFAHSDDDASDSDADKMGSGSHGTHVAGTIAQRTNNGEGVAGMAPDAKILPVRVFGYMQEAGGVSTTSEIVAAGIVYAVDNGANIINLSLGGYTDSQTIREACDYAYRAGVTVIAASGNDGYTDTLAYPAAYDSVIAVGATGPRGDVAYYSNQGKQLDLVAPGGDMTADSDGDGVVDGILQETTTGGNKFEYALFQGTSMASPHVAGLAALLYARGITDPDDIYEALTETARDLGGKGRDNATGYGLINPVDALNYTPTGKGRKRADADSGKGGKGGRSSGDPGRSKAGRGGGSKVGGADRGRSSSGKGREGKGGGGKSGKSGKAGRR